MPAIFKISCGASSYQPPSYKGGAFDISFFFFLHISIQGFSGLECIHYLLGGRQ